MDFVVVVVEDSSTLSGNDLLLSSSRLRSIRSETLQDDPDTLENRLDSLMVPNAENSSPLKVTVEIQLYICDLTVCMTRLIQDLFMGILLEKLPACSVKRNSHLSSLLHRNI